MRQTGNASWTLAALMVLGLGCGGSRPSGGAPTGSAGAGASTGEGTGGAATGSGGAGGSVWDGGGGSAGVGVPSDPTFVDGTRLVAQTYSFAGTAPLFVGIYDRQEHVACEFRIATDGKLRCLPPSVPDPDPAGGRWQEGTPSLGAATGLRLRRFLILTSDGGVFPSDLADDMYGKPCSPNTTRELDGTGAGACLPLHALLTGLYFADAACTQPLAEGPGKGRMPLLIATPKREVFALGQTFTGAMFIQYGMGGQCLSFSDGTVPSGNDYYRIGDPLPASAVAALRITPRGTGRLALQTVEFEGVGLAHVRHRAMSSPQANDGPYFDRELGTLCRPTGTVAGEVRCVPDQAYYVPQAWLTNFADPGCTQPVVNQKASAAVLLRTDATSGRRLAIEVRSVGAEGTNTAYSRANNTAGECREYLKGAGYPLGDVIPMDSFAAVEFRTGE